MRFCFSRCYPDGWTFDNLPLVKFIAFIHIFFLAWIFRCLCKCAWLKNYVWIFSSTASTVTNGTIATTEDITVTSNSTQTPCDLSPLPINDDMLPQAHHQNPGHCIASFAAINQMRQNSQVILIYWIFLLVHLKFEQLFD